MQEIIVYIALVVSVVFLVKRLFIQPKKSDCGINCKCKN